MKQIFNISGKADKVSELIREFKSYGTERIVTDIFPCNPDCRDVNVSIDDSQVDRLTDWCEANDLKAVLI